MQHNNQLSGIFTILQRNDIELPPFAKEDNSYKNRDSQGTPFERSLLLTYMIENFTCFIKQFICNFKCSIVALNAHL